MPHGGRHFITRPGFPMAPYNIMMLCEGKTMKISAFRLIHTGTNRTTTQQCQVRALSLLAISQIWSHPHRQVFEEIRAVGLRLFLLRPASYWNSGEVEAPSQLAPTVVALPASLMPRALTTEKDFRQGERKSVTLLDFGTPSRYLVRREH